MHWTPSSAGNQKTWTWSGWVKRVNFNEECVLFSGSASAGANYYITFSGGTGTGTGPDGLSFFYGYGIHVGTAANTFRDPNAWYHVVVAVDTTQSTPAERVKIYVNGTEVTYSYTNYPSQDADLGINSSYRMSMGAINSYAAWSLSDMYLADVHFIDGQALAPAAFGEVDSNNVWQPKEASIPSPNNEITWSNYVTISEGNTGTNYNTDATNMFDGDTSTSTALFSGNMVSPYSPTTVVFTPPSAMTVNTGIRVYMAVNRLQKIFVNGNETNASVTAGWNDVAFTGTLTSLTIGPTQLGSSSNINAIEIDGVVLVDGATAYGTNGFHLDFSDSSSDAALGYDAAGSNNWTVNNLSAPPSNAGQYVANFVSSNGFNASYPAMKAFDGNTSTYAQATATGGSITFTPSTPIAYSSSIKINMPSAGATASVNGGSAVSVANSSETTIATGSGTLTSLVLTASNLPGLLYIKIDDEILVDSGLDSGTDSLVDSPTSNYCTWNPLHRTGATLTNGNLEATLVAGGYGRESVRGTLAVSSGKYYWEEFLSDTGNQSGFYGVVGASTQSNIRLDSATSGTNAVLYAAWNGNKAINGVSTAYGEGFTTGDIIGVALDLDGGTITFYKNGSSQGSITLPATGIAYTPTFVWNGASSSGTTKTNFGQRPFTYPAPSGYQALTTASLPEPTIEDGSKHFDVVKYEGNSSTNVISGLGFSPDLVWIKGLNGYSHCLFDTVRGAGKRLATDGTWAEDDYNLLNSFNNDGFTLGTTAGGGAYVQNTTGSDAVAWAWNAGDTTETIAAGDLNSSAYDQSQVWSSTGTITNADTGYNGIARAFDGSLDNTAQDYWFSQVGTTSRYTFASPYAGTKFELYMGVSIAATNFSVNGQSSINVSGAMNPQWVDVTDAVTASGLGGLSYIDISYVSGQYSQYIFAIRVDGKMLIDPGITVPAVPSIASEVRANPTAGFSVVTWDASANATVAHGLNTTPQLVITKSRNNSTAWRIWSAEFSDADSDYLGFDSNAVSTFSGAYWGSMTSTTIGMSAASYDNNYGEMLAYCFASVEGYSSIGSFTGNGSADGPFVYTGFKPRWIMWKSSSNSGEHWHILDTERDPNNLTSETLYANLTNAESTFDDAGIDILSNGFKVRGTNPGVNGNGYTYIYMAFAENPVNTPPEVDTSGDTQVSLDPLAAIATDILEIDGTTMYLNGATGPWRTGLSIEGSQINAAPPGPSEITFTSQNQGTPAFSGVDATLASRTWTLESGPSATGPWTLVDTYSDFEVLNTQTGATPWTENKPTLQPNTYYRIKVQYNSTNAESVESVYNTFKTGDA